MSEWIIAHEFECQMLITCAYSLAMGLMVYDAKIKLRNAEITLDGNGDGKVEGESING